MQEALNRLHCNFGRFLIGEVELPCENTAERYAGKSLRRGQLQTGVVASGKQIPVPLCYLPLHDRPYCVQHISGRQIVALGYFGLPGRLGMPLLLYQADGHSSSCAAAAAAIARLSGSSRPVFDTQASRPALLLLRRSEPPAT